MDALIQHRRERGLPGISLAWGAWEQAGMATEVDVDRMGRSGMPPLTTEHGLRLFDAALSGENPVVLPVRLDLAAIRSSGEVPRRFVPVARCRRCCAG
ncbi:hypothetical protein [Saccharopolyspora halophila]|uniref:hypothetical protein n=1 Tax=Saccharopolyspora halophila TaxID=405551 RepID=UPI003CD0A2D2